MIYILSRDFSLGDFKNYFSKNKTRYNIPIWICSLSLPLLSEILKISPCVLSARFGKQTWSCVKIHVPPASCSITMRSESRCSRIMHTLIITKWHRSSSDWRTENRLHSLVMQGHRESATRSTHSCRHALKSRSRSHPFRGRVLSWRLSVRVDCICMIFVFSDFYR